LLSFSLLLSFGFLLGCADNNARRGGGGGATPNSDPLVGSVLTPPTPVPAATVGQPTPTLTPTPAGGTSAVPPVPVNGSTLSNAALAGGGIPKPVDGEHQLRISEPAAQGATLRPPESVPVVPVARPQPMGTATTPSHVTTLEQGQTLLEARGVQWQQLAMIRETGEWKFSCAIATPQNPNVSRTYEGRAKTGLAAMQAVLDQIDKDAAPATP
jgi:hypothetical protein